MRVSHAPVALVLVVSLAGCTDDGGDGDNDIGIAETPLAGTVGGEPWTFVAGDTNAFLSSGDPDFFANFYPTTFTTCNGFGPSGKSLIVAVPKTPGDYDFTTQRNMTFVVGPGDNLVTLEGRVRVDTVTATSLTGGLVGRFDADNDVSGTFTINVCPEGP
jgi:hypothetical protein